MDPRIDILKDEFVKVYPKVSHLGMFTMMPELVEGFNDNYLNIEKREENSFYAGKSAMALSEI